MDAIYQLRETIISIIKKYEPILTFSVKFITGLFVFALINSIGHYNAAFSFIGNLGWFINIFLGLLFAILPLNAVYLIIMIFLTIQFTAQLEIALIVFLGLLSMFLFYGHFGKKENVLILATVMGFYFNLPYIVPLVAGLYFSITSIIPISIGIFIWSYSYLIIELVTYETTVETGTLAVLDLDLDEILHSFMRVYESFTMGGDAVQNWIVVTIAMFIPFIFVYIISRLSINYSKELAIALGSVLNIFAFLFASLFINLGFGIIPILFFNILSAAMVYMYSFFYVVLDYKRTQRVEFQDEDYYYYVKLIPKIKRTH